MELVLRIREEYLTSQSLYQLQRFQELWNLIFAASPVSLLHLLPSQLHFKFPLYPLSNGHSFYSVLKFRYPTSSFHISPAPRSAKQNAFKHLHIPTPQPKTFPHTPPQVSILTPLALRQTQIPNPKPQPTRASAAPSIALRPTDHDYAPQSHIDKKTLAVKRYTI